MVDEKSIYIFGVISLRVLLVGFTNSFLDPRTLGTIMDTAAWNPWKILGDPFGRFFRKTRTWDPLEMEKGEFHLKK